jgi:hypothetical protein
MVFVRILIVVLFTMVFVWILIVALFTMVYNTLYIGYTYRLYVRILMVDLSIMVFVRNPINQLPRAVLAKDPSCKVNSVASYLKVDRPHGKDSALVSQESDGGDPSSQLGGESGHFSSLVASESHPLQIRTQI